MRRCKVLFFGLALMSMPLCVQARSQIFDGHCREVFQVIAQRAQAKLGTEFAELSLPDEEIQRYLMSLDKTPEGVRRQIVDLLDLRLEIERKGPLQDPEKDLKYRALNWKNENLGLIPGDIHGREFTAAGSKYSSLRNRARKTFIRRYASSRNPEFARLWLGLMEQEKDPELLQLLREVASARQIKLDYAAPDLKKAIFSQVKDESSKLIGNELSLIPDKMLTELLASRQPGASLRATSGFAGRSLKFLRGVVLKHPNAEVRAVALERLPEASSPSYLDTLLQAAGDKSELVRRVAASALDRQVGQPKADAQLLALTKDPDSKTAALAKAALKQRYQIQSISEGKLVRIARVMLPDYSDRQIVEAILGSDHELALKAASVAHELPLQLRYEALRATNPEIRLKVVDAIRTTDGRYTPELNQLLLSDPVADIRVAGVRAMDKQVNGPQGTNLLLQIAENDADERVRLEARAILHHEKSGPARLRVNESWEISYKKYLADAVKEFGAEGVREHDVMPLIAAQHIYLAPEADTAANALELVAKHQKFLQSAPPGYKVSNIVTDPLSGLKAAIYRSADSNERPLIISIAGTETRSDRIVDLNLGLLQARSPSFQRLLDAAVNAATAGDHPKVVITGHSLGGALSQIFGQELIAALQAQGHGELAENVRVATWNSLGGLKPLKRKGTYDAEIAKKMNAVNYYAPGDFVSMIGDHVGETVEVRGLKISGPLKVHSIEVLKDAFLRAGGANEAIAKQRALVLRILPEVARVTGRLTDALQYFRYKTKERATFMKLAQARLEWAGEEDYKVIAPEYDWLKSELDAAAERMFGEKNRQRAREYIQWIEKERQRVIEEKRMQAQTPLAPTSPSGKAPSPASAPQASAELQPSVQ